MFEGTIHWISISVHINWTLTVCRHSVKLWGCRCGLITVRCGLVTVLPLNLVYGLVAKKACTQMKYRTKNILSITKRNRLSRTVSKAFIFTESIPTHPWLRCLIQHLHMSVPRPSIIKVWMCIENVTSNYLKNCVMIWLQLFQHYRAGETPCIYCMLVLVS